MPFTCRHAGAGSLKHGLWLVILMDRLVAAIMWVQGGQIIGQCAAAFGLLNRMQFS